MHNEIYSLIYIGNYEGSEMGHQFDGTNSPYLAQLAQTAHCPTINQDDVIRYTNFSLIIIIYQLKKSFTKLYYTRLFLVNQFINKFPSDIFRAFGPAPLFIFNFEENKNY